MPSTNFFLLFFFLSSSSASNLLFREYIGAKFNGVKFTDIPINPSVDFHFILAFAIDYTTSHPNPTNGDFNVFWDNDNLTPSSITAVKKSHRNVKVALSIGGDSVGSSYAYFSPTSVSSWVNNAVSSLTNIIKEYGLDGIDIDYEHFRAEPEMFADCIGQLITRLKSDGIISFASIAPYADKQIQSHYLELWRKYRHAIDYVNFQFYAYGSGTSVSQFLEYFDEQSRNYAGGKVLVSFATDGSGGLGPQGGFFSACNSLKKQGKMHGVFIWSADDSLKSRFRYERLTQYLLAGDR